MVDGSHVPQVYFINGKVAGLLRSPRLNACSCEKKIAQRTSIEHEFVINSNGECQRTEKAQIMWVCTATLLCCVASAANVRNEHSPNLWSRFGYVQMNMSDGCVAALQASVIHWGAVFTFTKPENPDVKTVILGAAAIQSLFVHPLQRFPRHHDASHACYLLVSASALFSHATARCRIQ